MKDNFKWVEIDQFKDEDIIKALKYCIDENVPCDNCPCWKNCCTLEKDCLSLINRQKAKIEKLKTEIERIEKELTEYKLRLKMSECTVDEIKSEAYKECLAKVKNYIKTHCNPYGKPDFDYDTSIKILNFIDYIVKEMTEVAK